MHGVLVLIMFCSWKRLSQGVCNIQIRMYFANLYVSLLDQIADGIEASLDVLGSLVKFGFDTLGITPWSVMNSFIQIASCAASEAAMYSASHVDPATTLCLQLHQLTAPPFKYTHIRFVT